jgi:hypothetical protein
MGAVERLPRHSTGRAIQLSLMLLGKILALAWRGHPSSSVFWMSYVRYRGWLSVEWRWNGALTPRRIGRHGCLQAVQNAGEAYPGCLKHDLLIWYRPYSLRCTWATILSSPEDLDAALCSGRKSISTGLFGDGNMAILFVVQILTSHISSAFSVCHIEYALGRPEHSFHHYIMNWRQKT